MKRLLITGAAGGVGRVARTRLAHLADVIRLSDIADLGEAGPNEELVQCDLSDEAAVFELVKDCDAILHLGGVSIERTYDEIDAGNLRGVYNLYEAARANGMPRIVFASSNHTIGYYEQDQRLTVDMPTKPDGWYGVSKVFGEAVAHMYHQKFGQETAILRIGSLFDKPVDRRMMATWFSFDDFVSLMERVFAVPRLGCPTIWGASANTCGWWDNSHIGWLGWTPKDDSEVFRAEIEQQPKRPADAPDVIYQGGMFTANPVFRNE
ncbi:NAD-dependent epimerase/dehydratase family protein [Donghicola tyrosinivorans]|uniref:Uronate dehydrogenase n=1 Tax=Donghicola tyrosinivorans TaxID=1652492 RepID=A0A2T0WFV3_9RHOB|nr:NAD(P)-dependent oxidoreductase [Donghicola tyrosinivorans]PRY85590.1 uronate dehydrogenase [Donghicola tyrosinivorans]